MRQFIKSIREISKLIHHGPSSNDIVKVCPVCLGRTIELRPNRFLGFIIPSTYYCRKCKYNGPILAEIERKEYEKLNFEEIEVIID